MLDFGYYNMDCMKGIKEFPDKFFDLAIVDPEYGIGDFTKVGDANYYKKKADEKYGPVTWNNERPSRDYFEKLIRVSKNRIIWGANYYWEFIPEKNFIVWYKDNDSSRWSKCEIASCSIGVSKFVKFTWNGFVRCEKVERIHPCQKPVALYKWLLTKYAKPGDKILDTHVGSASSLIACEDLGFQYVGFELDKDYYEASCKRLEDFRAQPKFELKTKTEYGQISLLGQ